MQMLVGMQSVHFNNLHRRTLSDTGVAKSCHGRSAPPRRHGGITPPLWETRSRQGLSSARSKAVTNAQIVPRISNPLCDPTLKPTNCGRPRLWRRLHLHLSSRQLAHRRALPTQPILSNTLHDFLRLALSEGRLNSRAEHLAMSIYLGTPKIRIRRAVSVL